jgi:ABC-type oligopeptide transport system ATPase subunit
MTKIINLIGSSGSGKSTTAAGLFFLMKIRGMKVELIHEYAKYLTWTKQFSKLENQAIVLGKQYQSQKDLLGQVDYIITDSPLLLSKVYTNDNYPQEIKDVAVDLFREFDNLTFFIKRVKPFVQLGRNENEEESDRIAKLIKIVLYGENVPYIEIDGDENAPKKILDYIK